MQPIKIKRISERLSWRSIAIFCLLLFIFLANGFHEKYPDEFDSIVGGKFISQGKIPYKDWFQHHQPGAYVLAALLLPFSGNSFVHFRVFLSISFFLLLYGGYLLLKRRFKKKKLLFYLIFLVILALSATYFWGQMLLADVLAAYLILPAFALLLLKSFFPEKFTLKDLAFFSVFAFLTWFTSMTYTYLLAGLYLYALYLYISQNFQFPKLLKAIIILITPFLLFFAFFIMTGSLNDWYFSNITYNQKYYIYNYPRQPGKSINPIRYAIVIANDFINNFYPHLAGVKSFPLDNPFNMALAVSAACLIIYLLIKKKYRLLFPILIGLIYSNSRSNPAAIKETDYQSSVYIVLFMFSGLFVLAQLWKDLDKERLKGAYKLIGWVLFLILSVYWFFNTFFIGMKFFQKYYAKYMGQAPLIYDRPQVAPILNKIVGANEYAWVGPFEFEELFYLKAKIPSKYHWFLDHIKRDKKMKSELLADFRQNRPKVIVFKRNYAPWGGDASTFNSFFTNWLDKNYFRIFELNKELDGFRYEWKIGNTQNFDIDEDFYFNRRNKDELLDSLLQLDFLVRRKKD